MNAAKIRDYAAPADLLTNKVILVTGAAAGIGRAVATACAAHGATVVLLDRALKQLEELYDEISAADLPQPALYPLNLEGAAVKDYDELCATLEREFGRLDGLLNNAAWVGGLTPLRNYKVEHWTRSIAINLHAPFLLTRACLPALEKSTNPSIVFSTHACSRAYWGAYAVAKEAQVAMLRVFADELDGDHPIRVNGIDTGAVHTNIRSQNYPGSDPADLPAPADVTNGYLWLMGDESLGTTGQNFLLEK